MGWTGVVSLTTNQDKNNCVHYFYLRVFKVTLIQTPPPFLKLSKCEFCLSDVSFLGHVTSTNGIDVDPIKVETVSQWESSKYVSEIHSFLGLASYYKNFIEGF